MCLTLRSDYKKPYNRSKYRWKVAYQFNSKLQPFYQNGKYDPKKWMKAQGAKRGPESYGFHVLVDQEQLRRFAALRDYVVHLKVQVRGFLAAGVYDATHKSETWKYMRIVQIKYPESYTGPKIRCAKPTRR